MKCPKCGGSGAGEVPDAPEKELCGNCHGSGKDCDQEGEEMRCQHCEGGGFIDRKTADAPRFRAGDRVMVEATVKAVSEDVFYVSINAYPQCDLLGYRTSDLHPLPLNEEAIPPCPKCGAPMKREVEEIHRCTNDACDHIRGVY